MVHHVSEDIPCVLMVSAELRTSVIMRKGNDLFDRRILVQFLLENFLDVLGNAVHASYCRDDPEFVADTGLAVLPFIAFEICLRLCRGDFSEFWSV